MTYACDPGWRKSARGFGPAGSGRTPEADKRYKVAGWASVAEGVAGEPVWDVVERYLRDIKVSGVARAQRAEVDRRYWKSGLRLRS